MYKHPSAWNRPIDQYKWIVFLCIYIYINTRDINKASVRATDLKPTKIIKLGESSVYSRYWFGFVGLCSGRQICRGEIYQTCLKDLSPTKCRLSVGYMSVWCQFCRGVFGDMSVLIRSPMVDGLSVLDRLGIGHICRPTWHPFKADSRPNQVRHNTELRGVGRHISESNPTSARHISNQNRM